LLVKVALERFYSRIVGIYQTVGFPAPDALRYKFPTRAVHRFLSRSSMAGLAALVFELMCNER
jgi:hypothetical protein